MKRRISIFAALVMLLCAASAFAGFEYKLDLLSFKPLYGEFNADRNRAGLDLQYAYVYDGYPTYIYQGGNRFDFHENTTWRVKPCFAVYHIGETLSLMRNTFTVDHWLSPIAIDLSVHGSLTNVMEGEIADTVGYDGVYFYGLSAQVSKYLSMRFGYSHYCTHYGDGTYKQLEQGGGVSPGFDEWFKYLRMDSALFGVSVFPVQGVRMYAEVNFNLKSTHLMPHTFSPSWTAVAPTADDVPASYGARIVSFGIELEYPIFKKLGMTRLSYGCRAFEEGKIVYKTEELEANGKDRAYYDPDRPWEFEHTINLAQDVNDLVSFEVTWHYGRFILNSYYATRSSYVSIGARLNFDGTVTLYDSGK